MGAAGRRRVMMPPCSYLSDHVVLLRHGGSACRRFRVFIKAEERWREVTMSSKESDERRREGGGRPLWAGPGGLIYGHKFSLQASPRHDAWDVGYPEGFKRSVSCPEA